MGIAILKIVIWGDKLLVYGCKLLFTDLLMRCRKTKFPTIKLMIYSLNDNFEDSYPLSNYYTVYQISYHFPKLYAD